MIHVLCRSSWSLFKATLARANSRRPFALARCPVSSGTFCKPMAFISLHQIDKGQIVAEILVYRNVFKNNTSVILGDETVLAGLHIFDITKWSL